MAAIPYMPLYISDYMADAAHLNTVQHGAYLLLLMNYWQRGKALPAADAALANIARLSLEDWASNRDIIAGFFVESDGSWINQRAEKELSLFRQKSEASRLAGIASAAKRKLVPVSTDVERTFNERSTDVQRPSNGCSTDVERTFNHTDTDTDKNKTPKSPLPKKRVKRTPVALPFSDIPGDWLEFAEKSCGWGAMRSGREFVKLESWANRKDIRRADWLGTWGHWVGKAELENPEPKAQSSLYPELPRKNFAKMAEENPEMFV